ncbi:Acyl-CoA carboxylase epsilon subunit [Microlunatus sagamiharensis]|uniref:Acyl-CoA carboxylase epsilon subunit n=1 Tax=Microlunatus sagamiharensis TaxID=546874 RepID=A0A1H2LL06_9ACTN|nr:acyl-CoA carboxylase subunit epsilon [Microlunatus sagamiharensis]SDU81532.1 Acyl-CoA carboxylase epsilon subunit [Microlunatus sagamiharensis]
MSDTEDVAPEPLFRVVRGTPTDVELAALSVVLAARTRPVEEPAPPRQGPSAWAASARGGRTLGRPGPDAWRLSARG